MRTITYIIQKEFLQIFRNRSMLPIIFILPILQLLVLAYAANYDIKNIAVTVVDQDHSQGSLHLEENLLASGYFKETSIRTSVATALEDIRQDKSDVVVTIPPHFERRLLQGSPESVQVYINAINGMEAGIASGYLQSILEHYSLQAQAFWYPRTTDFLPPPSPIQVSTAYWYNPHKNYKEFMVPGILVVLITMIGAFLTGMNIVREKETGTIEQLNVTPIRKLHFIIGKLFPLWAIALVELAFGLGFAWFVFRLTYLGSIGLVFLFAGVYLTVMLGIGLLVSTRTQTQQQAMFITWFFVVIFLLLSGLFTPISSMPYWAQVITWFNPIAWFIKVIRMVLIKGSSWSDIVPYFLIIVVYSVIINGVAILAYRKRN